MTLIESGTTKYNSIESVAAFYVETLLGITRKSSEGKSLSQLVKKAMKYQSVTYQQELETRKSLQSKIETYIMSQNVGNYQEVTRDLMSIINTHEEKKGTPDIKEVPAEADFLERNKLRSIEGQTKKLNKILEIGRLMKHTVNWSKSANKWYRRTYLPIYKCFSECNGGNVDKFLEHHKQMSTSNFNKCENCSD